MPGLQKKGVTAFPDFFGKPLAGHEPWQTAFYSRRNASGICDQPQNDCQFLNIAFPEKTAKQRKQHFLVHIGRGIGLSAEAGFVHTLRLHGAQTGSLRGNKKSPLSLEMPDLSRTPAHDRIRKAQKLPARSNSNMNKKNTEN